MQKADKIRLGCYILAVAAALAYPVAKIISFEYPSVPPNIYIFETAIYDPYDPMRGRYVRLNFNQNQVRLPGRETKQLDRGRRCYAVLEKHPDGTARIADLVADIKQLPAGKDFLKVKYSYYSQDYNQKTKEFEKTGFHVIKLPFDRFYLNERLAPEAEKEVRESTRPGQAFVRVKVYRNGNCALDDLIVDGKPILERLREKPAK